MHMREMALVERTRCELDPDREDQGRYRTNPGRPRGDVDQRGPDRGGPAPGHESDLSHDLDRSVAFRLRGAGPGLDRLPPRPESQCPCGPLDGSRDCLAVCLWTAVGSR